MGRAICAEDTHGVLEDHSLGVALTNPLGFDAVATYWLLFAAFNTTFPTGFSGLDYSDRMNRDLGAYLNNQFWFVSSGVCGGPDSSVLLPLQGYQRRVAPRPVVACCWKSSILLSGRLEV